MTNSARRLLVAVLVAACEESRAGPPPTAPSPLVSSAAPEVRRAAIDGSQVDTGARRGRVVVVDFFAEHCKPCVRSLPEMEATHRARPEVAVVGISEDDDLAGAQRMVATYGLTFPVIHDRERALAGRFRVGELPATFVIDGAGVVRWVGSRPHTAAELSAVIDSVSAAAYGR